MRAGLRESCAAVVLAAATLAAPARAGLITDTVTYACERGVRIEASYVTGAEGAVAVLQVEGRQVALSQAISASGARYAQTLDTGGNAQGYVWWTKGDTAFLEWQPEGASPSVTLLTDCRATA